MFLLMYFFIYYCIYRCIADTQTHCPN